jgi:hypothetical protein
MLRWGILPGFGGNGIIRRVAVHDPALEFPSSAIRDVLATRSCLLYAERMRDSPYRRKDPV